MKPEACFADFKIDVQCFECRPKQVTFDENILQMKTYLLKDELLKLLNVEVKPYVHPQCLDLVIITGNKDDADHEVVIPNNDSLQQYHGLLSRCHLIKITHGSRWSLKKSIGFYCSRVQDHRGWTYLFGFIFLTIAGLVYLWY